MKLIIFSFFFCIFQVFVWAEIPLNKKSGAIHIEHPDHVPHHPSRKDASGKTDHDGIRYPRKKLRNRLLTDM